jgi:hypothetical protein
MGQPYGARAKGSYEQEGKMVKSSDNISSRQDALLQEAMKQPGAAALMEAYNAIETAYSEAAAATTVTPVVITTNSAR